MTSCLPALYILYYEEVQSGWALKCPGRHIPTQNTPSFAYAPWYYTGQGCQSNPIQSNLIRGGGGSVVSEALLGGWV